jgi:hypothetical protein
MFLISPQGAQVLKPPGAFAPQVIKASRTNQGSLLADAVPVALLSPRHVQKLDLVPAVYQASAVGCVLMVANVSIPAIR